MKGLSWASLKSHPSLIPLYVCLGAGVVGAAFYTLRIAVKSPDVSWNRNKNPRPNEEYRDKQYKFYAPNLDYKNLQHPAPKFEE